MSAKRQLVPFAEFEEIASELDVSLGKLADMVGYSSEAVFTWRKDEKLPYTALLAAKYLLRQKKDKVITTKVFVIAVDEAGHAEAIDRMLQVVGVPANRVMRLD